MYRMVILSSIEEANAQHPDFGVGNSSCCFLISAKDSAQLSINSKQKKSKR